MAGEHPKRWPEDQANAGTPALSIPRCALTRRADELPGRGGDSLADGLPGSLSWRLAHHLARPGFARSRHNKILRLNEFTHKLEEYRGTSSNYLTLTGDATALLERRSAQQERDISRLRKTSQNCVASVQPVSASVSPLISASPPWRQQAKPAAGQPPHQDRFPVRPTSGQIVLRADNSRKPMAKRGLSHHQLSSRAWAAPGRDWLEWCRQNHPAAYPAWHNTASAGKVTLSDRVRTGYYAQENEGLDYENSVYNEALAVLPTDSKRMRTVLGHFLFNGDRVFQRGYAQWGREDSSRAGENGAGWPKPSRPR